MELAAAQGFALTREQLTKCRDAAYPYRLVRDGVLDRIAPGVFELVDPPMDLVSRLRRLSLCSPEPLIACGPTAAQFHGFTHRRSETLHVTTASGRSLHLPRGVIVRQTVRRSPWQSFNGVHVLDPADTAVDLARAAPPPTVLSVLDDAVRAGVRPDLLGAAVRRAGGLRGVLKVRELVDHVSASAESPMESRVRQLLIEAGFVDVEVQLEVIASGRRRRLDLAFRNAKVGVEYDGEDFHTGDGSMARDRERHNDLVAAGWILLHVTARDLRNPARFLARLRTLLTTRGYVLPTAP